MLRVKEFILNTDNDNAEVSEEEENEYTTYKDINAFIKEIEAKGYAVRNILYQKNTNDNRCVLVIFEKETLTQKIVLNDLEKKEGEDEY